MARKEKKTCVICGEKAGVFTRVRINDGLLCGDCVKRCSEHIDSFENFTAEEIHKHLEYRIKNKKSKIFAEFSPNLFLGDYETIKVDQAHKTWALSTAKRYGEQNQDVFYLSQVTGCEIIEKKELYFPAAVDPSIEDPSATERIKKKIIPASKHVDEYGAWFYLNIYVNHPCFSTIIMRMNRYIIPEKMDSDYSACKLESDEICNTFWQLCLQATQSLE